jgi:two-component system response regulator EvgA
MHSIFIVDDHPVIRFGMRMVLEDAGYLVVGESDNGVDAMQMIRETEPDLLLLDILMPRLDGLELLGRLRAMNNNVKALMLTVQPAAHFTRRCISCVKTLPNCSAPSRRYCLVTTTFRARV